MKNFGYKCLIIKNKNAIKTLKSYKRKDAKDLDTHIKSLKRQNRIFRLKQIISILNSIVDRM